MLDSVLTCIFQQGAPKDFVHISTANLVFKLDALVFEQYVCIHGSSNDALTVAQHSL